MKIRGKKGMIAFLCFPQGMNQPLFYVRDMNNKLNETYKIQTDNYVIKESCRVFSFRQIDIYYIIIHLAFFVKLYLDEFYFIR